MSLKYSRQRESIKKNLLQRRDHPTADMVYEDIRKIYPNVSLGTVYRNLSLLSEIGELRRLSAVSGADRFDARVEPHNHFTCTACGCVIDIADGTPDAMIEEAGRSFEGRIDGCSIMFYGICPQCKAGNHFDEAAG